MELVHLYFDFVHDQFHSLFHRPSLEEDVLNGTAPAVLLYGIMALSARFVSFNNTTNLTLDLAYLKFRHQALTSSLDSQQIPPLQA